ncbi:MAG TPA: SdpI family protein [Candidatus Eisenbacteria bacterium]|nr:SdpI family protein [Candidatus Eisenbacteria bacterium]
MSPVQVLVMVFVAFGALMVALAIPLILRRVRPNAIYGLRVPATFADEEVWYEANAWCGRDMVVLGSALVILPLVIAFLPISETAFAVFGVALGLVGPIVMAVVGWRRANRLLREKREGKSIR